MTTLEEFWWTDVNYLQALYGVTFECLLENPVGLGFCVFLLRDGDTVWYSKVPMEEAG